MLFEAAVEDAESAVKELTRRRAEEDGGARAGSFGDGGSGSGYTGWPGESGGVQLEG